MKKISFYELLELCKEQKHPKKIGYKFKLDKKYYTYTLCGVYSSGQIFYGALEQDIDGYNHNFEEDYGFDNDLYHMLYEKDIDIIEE